MWPWARFNAMQHDSYRWDFIMLVMVLIAKILMIITMALIITTTMFTMINSNNIRCGMYPGSIGFPTRRKKELGNYIASNNSTMWFRCPKQCRRQPEWTHC